MGEAGRNVKHGSNIGGQLVNVDLAPRHRILSQIDNDVMNASPCAANQLCIGFRRALKMHPPYRAANCRERRVTLYGAKIDPLLHETVDAPSSREISAVIAVHDDLHQPSTCITNTNQLHDSPS